MQAETLAAESLGRLVSAKEIEEKGGEWDWTEHYYVFPDGSKGIYNGRVRLGGLPTFENLT